MPESSAPALKDWFDASRYRWIASQLAELSPRFDRKRFLAHTLEDLADRSLLQRMRRTTEAIHASLDVEYEETLAVLRQLAPRVQHNFVSIVLPDYVALHGHDHFEVSMEALAQFTRFGSAEFAIREFLKRDLHRTLSVMERWSRDPDEHVRRLSSEGCRPRLPWSFRLEALIADPDPVAPILENLKADPALYVRKSVANHLNDISKDHPEWVLARLRRWGLDHIHTAWIARRATRTLIKAGNADAMQLFGVAQKIRAQVENLKISPHKLTLGEKLAFSFELVSTGYKPQRAIVDYAVQYRKKSAVPSRKVFKLVELTLPALGRVSLRKAQRFQDFTTRKHYPGEHKIEILLNGSVAASATFDLELKPAAKTRINSNTEKGPARPASKRKA